MTQIGAECLGRTCLPGRVGPIATADTATRMPRRRHCHVCGPMPAPVSCYQSASGERVCLCETLLFTPTAVALHKLYFTRMTGEERPVRHLEAFYNHA